MRQILVLGLMLGFGADSGSCGYHGYLLDSGRTD